MLNHIIAPGTYSPEKLKLNKGPEYSLYGKGRESKVDNIPGKKNIYILYIYNKWLTKFIMLIYQLLFSTWNIQPRKSEIGFQSTVQFWITN